MSPQLKHLDAHRAGVLERLCETIVPGSARVGPVVYIDAIMADMPVPQRDGLIHAIDLLEGAAARGAEGLEPHAATPEFQFIRALAIEAFYSDFLAPGAAGPSAYEEIDFHSPLAMRIKKDWSYLGFSAAPGGGASAGVQA
ncbi:MAG TPA: hypothetical protein VMF57_07655 [Solirubrobacteraceae bacterium]|nr:hypothetical protein [Solirubrobacteraceae bacterium]